MIQAQCLRRCSRLLPRSLSTSVSEVPEDETITFYTRTLEVHQAHRKFRPPRESWLYAFPDWSKRGLLELHPEVFAVNPRIDMIHAVIKWQDQCTAPDEIEYNRAELPGSKRKMWPQKGSGRARHKDKRAPQFKFGGTPWGKRPYDQGKNMPILQVVKGLTSMLTIKLAQNDLHIVDSLEDCAVSELADVRSQNNFGSVLFVTGHNGLSTEEDRQLSFHPGMEMLTTQTVHPKAVLSHSALVMDFEALKELETWILGIQNEFTLNETVKSHDIVEESQDKAGSSWWRK